MLKIFKHPLSGMEFEAEEGTQFYKDIMLDGCFEIQALSPAQGVINVVQPSDASNPGSDGSSVGPVDGEDSKRGRK